MKFRVLLTCDNSTKTQVTWVTAQSRYDCKQAINNQLEMLKQIHEAEGLKHIYTKGTITKAM